MYSSTTELEIILEKLRNQGMRITAPRRAIIDYLIESKTHPTIEEIYNDLKDDHPGMSLATVYNNVNFLVDQGLVYEMKFGQNHSRYDYLGDRHFHVMCEECGKIMDFESSDLSNINASCEEQTGFLLKQTKLEMYGICPECQRKMKH